MGRRPKYTSKEFTKAYKQSKSVHELASRLQITLPTVYFYIKKHALMSFVPLDKVNPVKIAKQYRYRVTIQDLADKNALSPGSVRYYLRKLLYAPASSPYCLTKDFPAPRRFSDIKIINALMKNKALVDNPAKLLEKHIGLSRRQVNHYWKHAFGFEVV